MDILKLMAKAQEADAAAQAEKLEAQRGTYHVGGTGIITDEGDCIGPCPRSALARVLGYERPIEPNRMFMFALGKANEDTCYADLEAAGAHFRKEGDILCSWRTRAGTLVEGHPDCDIGTRTVDSMTLEEVYEPEEVIEMKSVCSLWTARNVLFDRTPKMDHVIQAGHYMWQTGLPATIWYRSGVDWPVATGGSNGWLQKMFNNPEFKEYVTYNARGEVKKVNPFQVFFSLKWGPDGAEWQSLDNELHKGTTLVLPDSIERYYDMMDDMQARKHLGPRPAKLEADGKKMFWDRCDPAYCPWSAICDKCECDYDKWFETIKGESK